MAFKRPIGESSFASRGVTVSDSTCTGGGSLKVNYEGPAIDFGFVASNVTFTVKEAGAKGGTLSSDKVTWLDKRRR